MERIAGGPAALWRGACVGAAAVLLVGTSCVDPRSRSGSTDRAVQAPSPKNTAKVTPPLELSAARKRTAIAYLSDGDGHSASYSTYGVHASAGRFTVEP